MSFLDGYVSEEKTYWGKYLIKGRVGSGKDYFLVTKKSEHVDYPEVHHVNVEGDVIYFAINTNCVSDKFDFEHYATEGNGLLVVKYLTASYSKNKWVHSPDTPFRQFILLDEQEDKVYIPFNKIEKLEHLSNNRMSREWDWGALFVISTFIVGLPPFAKSLAEILYKVFD